MPITDVVGALQKAHQRRTIQISKGLELADELAEALGNLTLRDAEQTEPLPLAVGLVVSNCLRQLPMGVTEDKKYAEFDTFGGLE